MTVTLPTTQRVWTLTQLPAGLPDDSTFTLSTKALPELQPEQALVRLEYFSNDPVVRFRLPLFPIGEPVPIWGVGTVLKSTGKWKEGDSVFGNFGWYDVGVVDDKEIRCVAAELPGKPYASLSPLGDGALTAYQAMVDVLEVDKTKTVVIDGAAGSVGSCAVQIAHILGARVVGIAGGPKKCAWVKSLGAAEGVDYKAADFEEQLKAALPDGADRYLDMVGGKVFDSMLPNMAMHGVIGIIGGVSGYNGDYAAYRNMLMFPVKRLTLKGFTVFDYFEEAPKAFERITEWIHAGKFDADGQTIVDATVDELPTTWARIFAGVNIGKYITKLKQ